MNSFHKFNRYICSNRTTKKYQTDYKNDDCDYHLYNILIS